MEELQLCNPEAEVAAFDKITQLNKSFPWKINQLEEQENPLPIVLLSNRKAP